MPDQEQTRRRVLVTGGTGFVGRPCVERLARSGDEVHVATRSIGDLPAGVHRHAVDLLAGDQVSDLLQRVRPTHLLHLGWVTRQGQYWSAAENLDWVAASLRLLKEFSAQGGTRAVLAGSCAEYDWSSAEILSESLTPLQPATLYGTCKNSLRAIGEAFAQREGLSFAWGRLFFLYGPREHPQRLVASVIRSLLEGEPALCTAGTQQRDFLHVEDAAAALVHLLDSDLQGAMNIASGHAVAVRDVVQSIGKQLEKEDLLRLGALPTSSSESPVLVADVRRLREELGWVPQFDLGHGLAQTITWWQNGR